LKLLHLSTYGETFKAGFTNADLMLYCKAHPNMEQFLSCLRPNSSYVLFLDSFYRSKQSNVNSQNSLLKSQIASMVTGNYLNNFNTLLDSLLLEDSGFFSSVVHQTPDSLM